ncbi:hypothetical protein [Spirosoma montaniterrae]|uniref:ABC transporter ATPase n=1 Tax=Spirosoma montaniterrae TaxID=1178516 RepID=A0A1P9X1B8_9BACT|nr:hypothetical protein [Spirosoma montaniterrae]AQG81432.1 hypothetical protein AWR27_20190 [Spirosoma montaniterrae]
MYTNFANLPDTARVWVYQANRPLLDADVSTIQNALQPALEQWAAHGQPLLASAQVIENRFVVIGVDEGYNLPSGCSIDASVRTLQQIGQQAGIDFFDRSAAVRGADGLVQTFALPQIKAAVAAGQIAPDSIIFNTLVKTKAEFLTDWQILASQSWLKRYFGVDTQPSASSPVSAVGHD